MAFEGMDVPEVERLGKQLQHEGGEIKAMAQKIDGQINELMSHWKGKDATQFHGWWRDQHYKALMAAGDAVEGLGKSALNNVAAQKTASDS
jgi:uncharacterized protein YukE